MKNRMINSVRTASRPVAAASATPLTPVTRMAKIRGTTVMRKPLSQRPPTDSNISMACLTPAPPHAAAAAPRANPTTSAISTRTLNDRNIA